MKKVIPLFFVGLVIISLICVNYLQQHKRTPVELGIAKRGKLLSLISATGKLRARRQVNISAEILSRIERIYVTEGQSVEKGKLLCKLDDTQIFTNLKSSEAAYLRARNDFERVRVLYEKGLASLEEFEHLKYEMAIAKAQYDGNLSLFRKTGIYSPISGVVLKINAEEGEAVVLGTMNNPGTVIMVIADLKRMIVELPIDESDISRVKLHQKAKIYPVSFPDMVFEGEVLKIGFMAIPSSGSQEVSSDFKVEIEIENSSLLLKPGMHVKAEIIVGERTDAIVIPIQAVIIGDKEGKTEASVYIFRNGRLNVKPVKTGIWDDTKIEITDGLNDGDTIVVGPSAVFPQLKNGEMVSGRIIYGE